MRAAFLLALAIVACLGGCAAPSAPPPAAAQEAPGTFHVHLGGEITNAIGTAQP